MKDITSDHVRELAEKHGIKVTDEFISDVVRRANKIPRLIVGDNIELKPVFKTQEEYENYRQGFIDRIGYKCGCSRGGCGIITDCDK